MFRLCIRDEYGTRILDKPSLVLKSTALRHEIELRTARWRLTRKYSFLHKGCSWWTDNTGTLARLCATINDALRKYRARRLEAGLFYLDGHRKTATFTTTSHMYGDSEFLRDLWRKKRSERATRRNNQELCNTSASVRTRQIPRHRPFFLHSRRHAQIVWHDACVLLVACHLLSFGDCISMKHHCIWLRGLLQYNPLPKLNKTQPVLFRPISKLKYKTQYSHV
jgi:hypothetical protein